MVLLVWFSYRIALWNLTSLGLQYVCLPKIAHMKQVSSSSKLLTFTSLALWHAILCRYVLTQFNSHTLNTHISQSYPPAVFGGPKKQGFVDVLACHQTPDYNAWYRGSADAVRRNLPVILEQYRGAGIPEELLILSGQAVYRMVSKAWAISTSNYYLLWLTASELRNQCLLETLIQLHDLFKHGCRIM